MGSAYSMGASTLQGADAGKGQILVVEDDPTFGEALCQVLDRAGYAATLATDFRQRWKFSKQNSRWISCWWIS